MRIQVKQSAMEVDQAAAQEIGRQVLRKPGSVLGLSTGSTTVGLHRAVVALHRECGISFSAVRTFNVDEYVGVPEDHPASCRVRIFDQLLNRIDIPPGSCRLPDGNAENLELEAQAYEGLISAAGGIDLQVLGIGPNGHIGFNEPGTPFESHAHVAAISDRSLAAKADFYETTGFHPTRAITLGIRNIMEARIILLVAKGAGKADIMRRTLFGPVTTDVPASVLQLHPDALVLLDAPAASSLPAI